MEDVNLKSYAGISGSFIGREITIKGQKQYIVEGYISTGSVDLFGEQVTEECMRDMQEQIESGSIKMDLEHETYHENNYDIIPVARIMESKVDKKGLWVKALLNSAASRFKEIWASIKGGFLDAFSIQFVPKEAVVKGDVKVLNKVKLINVGITGTPVNPEARMENVMVKAIRDMELKANPANQYVPKPGEKTDDDEDEAEIKAAKTLLIGRGYKITDPLDVEKVDPEDFKRQVKAKYIKRTGSSGNYKYEYERDAKKRSDSTAEADDIMDTIDSIEKGDKGAFNELDSFHQEVLIDIYTDGGADQEKVQKLRDAGIYLIGDKKLKEEANKKYKDEAEAEIYVDEMQRSGDKKKAEKAVQTYKEDKKADEEHQAEKRKKQAEENAKKQAELSKLSKADLIKKLMTENKALMATQGGLTNPESQSTEQSDDNKKMAEETTVAPEAPVETPVEAPVETQVAPAEEPAPAEEADNSELEAEIKALKKENADLKASVAKIEKQLAQPQLKAKQEALPQKLNEGATPLSLIG